MEQPTTLACFRLCRIPWLAEVELELRDALRRELILTERLRAELEAHERAS